MALRRWERTDVACAREGKGFTDEEARRTVPTGHADGLLFAPQPGTVGIGYWVLGPARGRGLATRAVSLLVRWALDEGGMTRIEALVEPDNIASQRVLEHAGFQREGRLRSYLDLQPDGRRSDALVYSLLRDDL